MFADRNKSLLKPDDSDEYFFDRSPAAFEAILDHYRCGVLERPSIVPMAVFRNELDFWQMDAPREVAEVTDDVYPPQAPRPIFMKMVVDCMLRVMAKTKHPLDRYNFFVDVRGGVWSGDLGGAWAQVVKLMAPFIAALDDHGPENVFAEFCRRRHIVLKCEQKMVELPWCDMKGQPVPVVDGWMCRFSLPGA
ncbi:hypothetical protein HK101_007613 [Irineochytrium annulatum]|nr:hypothetical protein HK101_007613 [Irineochytrium annulatum]